LTASGTQVVELGPTGPHDFDADAKQDEGGKAHHHHGADLTQPSEHLPRTAEHQVEHQRDQQRAEHRHQRAGDEQQRRLRDARPERDVNAGTKGASVAE